MRPAVINLPLTLNKDLKMLPIKSKNDSEVNRPSEEYQLAFKYFQSLKLD